MCSHRCGASPHSSHSTPMAWCGQSATAHGSANPWPMSARRENIKRPKRQDDNWVTRPFLQNASILKSSSLRLDRCVLVVPNRCEEAWTGCLAKAPGCLIYIRTSGLCLNIALDVHRSTTAPPASSTSSCASRSMSAPVPTNVSPYLQASHPAKRIRTSQPRSGRKCDTCRQCKCKCLPLERDWSTGERCDECIRKGKPCGPHRYHNDPVGAPLPLPPVPASLKPPHQSPPSLHPHNALSLTQPNPFSPLQRSSSQAQARFEGTNESEDPAIDLGASAISPSWQSLPFTEKTTSDGRAAIGSFTQHFAVPNFSTFDPASRVRLGYVTFLRSQVRASSHSHTDSSNCLNS